jgi:hypothetical protein
LAISGTETYVTKYGDYVATDSWEASTDQAWQFVPVVKAGYFNIYQIYAGAGGRCMGEDTTADSLVTIVGCGSGDSARWQVQTRSGSTFQLANVASGKCLTYDYDYGYVYIESCVEPAFQSLQYHS